MSQEGKWKFPGLRKPRPETGTVLFLLQVIDKSKSQANPDSIGGTDSTS